MKSYWIPLLLVALFGFGTVALTGCGDAQTNSADAAECSCKTNEAAAAGWCEKCEVGHVKGEETECKTCVDAALGGPSCEACAAKKGAEEGGAKGATGSEGECGPDCKCCSNGECAPDCKCCAKRAANAAAGDAAVCLCEKGKAGEAVWCEKCDKGYVDGEPAHCKGCVAKAQKAAAK